MGVLYFCLCSHNSDFCSFPTSDVRGTLLCMFNAFQNLAINNKVANFALDPCVSVQMHFHHIEIEFPVGIFDFLECTFGNCCAIILLMPVVCVGPFGGRASALRNLIRVLQHILKRPYSELVKPYT